MFLRRSLVILASGMFSFLIILASGLPLIQSSLATDLQFEDVPLGHTNYIPIYSLVEDGVLTGKEGGLFHPGAEVLRVEALKMILELFDDFDVDAVELPAEPPFSDTPLDAWYIKYVQEAVNRGMVNGYKDGTFHPAQKVNLAEALKMLANSLSNYIPLGVTEAPFADVSKDAWFAEYFKWAQTRSMLHISATNEVQPSEESSRGYLASVLYKLKKFGNGYDFGKATYYGGVFHGRTTASGALFDMYGMTAAHKTLPFGTFVKATNLANGEYVVVEITDRGPYGYGRVLDLSEGAFGEIASLGAGIINIQYTVVDENYQESGTEDPNNPDLEPDPYTSEA